MHLALTLNFEMLSFPLPSPTLTKFLTSFILSISISNVCLPSAVVRNFLTLAIALLSAFHISELILAAASVSTTTFLAYPSEATEPSPVAGDEVELTSTAKVWGCSEALLTSKAPSSSSSSSSSLLSSSSSSLLSSPSSSNSSMTRTFPKSTLANPPPLSSPLSLVPGLLLSLVPGLLDKFSWSKASRSSPSVAPLSLSSSSLRLDRTASLALKVTLFNKHWIASFLIPPLFPLKKAPNMSLQPPNVFHFLLSPSFKYHVTNSLKSTTPL
mmetsp:Transcript_24277/g.50621  ORF Transcript_24277/g.50621 Transcript_24277/m.50621 type:complete len:270 (-) Transcript_24277:4013-4822(-)